MNQGIELLIPQQTILQLHNYWEPEPARIMFARGIFAPGTVADIAIEDREVQLFVSPDGFRATLSMTFEENYQDGVIDGQWFGQHRAVFPINSRFPERILLDEDFYPKPRLLAIFRLAQ